ncbi:MAG: hypothetical protein PVG62_14580 [Desulfobacterales bacterium]|jgi:hypothetical protein
MTSESKPVEIWAPANYRIVVDGELDQSWSDRLAGLRIKAIKRKSRLVVTTLSGQLTDQAELLGVLNSLYNLGLPLRVVERREE